jgi:spoIIIJ-associated protein
MNGEGTMFEDEKPLEFEAEGKTVDEAIRKGLIMSGWTREQVAVEVLNSVKQGTWVSNALARVRLTRKTGDALDLARRVTAEILERVGLSGQVQAERRPDHIQVVVQGDGLEEKLIGPDGEGLDALQHLVARIVSKQSGTRQMVSVDLGGFRQRRERKLRDMAYELADAVRQTGRQVMTDPMGAAERRVVHLALNEDPDITTFAVGDGLVKPITVAPIDQAPPPEERRSGAPERRPGERRPDRRYREGRGGGGRGRDREGGWRDGGSREGGPRDRGSRERGSGERGSGERGSGEWASPGSGGGRRPERHWEDEREHGSRWDRDAGDRERGDTERGDAERVDTERVDTERVDAERVDGERDGQRDREGERERPASEHPHRRPRWGGGGRSGERSRGGERRGGDRSRGGRR